MNTAVTVSIDHLFQPQSEAFLHNPVPTFRRLLRECPVGWYSPWAAWVVTPHDLCAKYLKDPRLSTRFTDWEFGPTLKPEHEKNDFDRMNDYSLFMVGHDHHQRLRKLTLPAFSKRVMDQIELKLKDLVRDCFDSLEGREEIDAYADIAARIPVRAIARMVGVPVDRESLFEDMAHGYVRVINPAITAAEREEAVQRMLPGIQMFKELIAERRALADPGDDFLGTLVSTSENGDRLVDWEIIGLIGALLAAGADTVVDLHTYTLYELLSHPEQFALLKTRPELMENAIMEVLRHGSPGKTGIHRYALEDLEIAGHAVRKGQQIMLSMGASHYDENKYPDPERFDITRNFDHNILFGIGPHYCIGINLAKVQGSLMLQEFMRRFPRASLAGPPEIDPHHHNARRIRRLPIHTHV